MVKFQAWYGLEDFDELDEEYAAVKAMINFEGEEPEVAKCPDGTAMPSGTLTW